MSLSNIDSSDRLRAERQAVETLYRAFSDRSPDLVDTVLAPDWKDIPLGPGQAPGPAGVKPIIQGFGKAFPDVLITIHELIQVPGRIAVRAEITGTHRGEIFGIAATGKKVSIPLHEFHTLDGRRVTATWHLEDWFGLFRQIGQLPPHL
jgi:predicted ester cyclase